MNKLQRIKDFFGKIEIGIAIVLFFTMLYSCGKYIDIKINGQNSSLPSLPQYEKQHLLKTGAAENKVYTDDLTEPVFIGLRDEKTGICAAFDSEARASFENLSNPLLYALFSGTSEKMSFDNEYQRKKYIEQLCNSEKYIYLSYFDDVHASLFLPCLSSDYEIDVKPMYFYVKHIFILGDENEYLYAVTVAKDGSMYKLFPEKKIVFDNFSTEEYDVSDGYSYFEFADREGVHPEFTSSFVTNKYELVTMSEKFGKNKDSFWVEKIFDLFAVNNNFVKSYSSKNDTEMIYVDDGAQVLVSDSGLVEYNAEGLGVNLEDYLEYSVDASGKYSFTDKVFAIKNLVNSLNFDNSSHRYTVSGIDYEQNGDKLSLYLKCFVNGVAVSERKYDAVFVIKSNYLVSASFPAFNCKAVDGYSVCMNQNYINTLFEESETDDLNNAVYCPVLEKDKDGKEYKVSWARISYGEGEE